MFKEIFLILPLKAKKRFIKTLFMSFFSSILELLSLGLIIPIIYFIIDPNNDIFNKIHSFLKFIPTENFHLYLIFSLIFIFIFKTLFLSYFAMYQNNFRRNLRTNLAQMFFTNYLKLQFIENSKKNFAEMQKNIDSETQRFSDLVQSYTMFINEAVMALTIILFLFLFNFQITLIISVILFIILIILYLVLKNRFKIWGIKGQEAFKNYNNTILQSFNNLRETKLRGKEDFFSKKFLKDNKLKNLYESNNRLFSILPRYLIELAAVLLIFLILYVMLTNNNDLDYVLATLGLFAYASVRLLPILSKLMNLLGQIKYFSYSSSLLSNEINKLKKNCNLNNRQDFKIEDIEKIELNNIFFSYKDKFILNNTSLKLEKGFITGIFGASGSGKSTLLDILSSLIIPDKGEIKINDKKIDSKDFFWGKEMSYISQNTDLFNDTIEYNITFGNTSEKINKKKLEYSLKASNLVKFVEGLPDGLKTVVGEKGSQISTGQKQRINIARAFYNDAKVLIMDESTNSLDTTNEELIFKDILKIKKNLIVIIVSHNKNLLKKFCDNLFELNEYQLNRI